MTTSLYPPSRQCSGLQIGVCYGGSLRNILAILLRKLVPRDQESLVLDFSSELVDWD